MKRSEIIAALKENNIPFKGNASNASLMALLPVKAEIMSETETIVPEKQHILFSVGIDQKNIEGAGIDNQIKVDLEFIYDEKQPLNLRQVAGNFANKLYSVIRLLPLRSKGYNLSILIDNQLVTNVRHKIDAKINFTNPVDIAAGLLGVLLQQFDTSNGEELFTGVVNNSGELQLVAQKYGLNSNTPLFQMMKAIEAKKAETKKAFKELNA